nr:unnamed protein product [Digitaria exilis]
MCYDGAAECRATRDAYAPPSMRIKSVLYYPFGFCIECAGRFVEEEDLGVLHNGTGNGDALLLPSG